MEFFQNGTHFGGIKQAANVRDPLIFRVVFGLVRIVPTELWKTLVH